MNIITIDVTALPLLFLPILFMLLSIISFYLYSKTRRVKDVIYGGVILVLIILAFTPYQAATGERLYFWSNPYHIATIVVMFGIGARMMFTSTKSIIEHWPFGILLILISISILFGEILAGTVVAFSIIGYGLYLLYQTKERYEHELLQGILFVGTGLFILIGQWLPFNGGRFLFSSMLVVLMGYEIIRFFDRVLIMTKAASINSLTDALTGLFNRGFLYKKSAQLLKKQAISVIFADIDNFKQLNDTKGHDAGDIVLKDVAKILKEVIGRNGYACRFGGEEMVAIVLTGEAPKLAERFRQQVEKLAGVTVSVGVADGSDDAELIIKEADKRMYVAKNSGKNRVVTGEDK
ncbi:GGDEF domain-containing protein [Psychrobacillus sp. FSL H8-0484]|uniref:GGDEF domain-containing protein n=1 Tax=Psychrobacillus sp. FSL H8-0484 TaxID=2921390 RepID=UPI0030FC64BF